MTCLLSFPLFSQNQTDSTATSPNPGPATTTTSPAEFEGTEADKLWTSFTIKEVELVKGQIISNVLKIYNNSNEVQNFKMDLLFPAEWREISARRAYQLQPGDTVFAPIVLIPRKLVNDNTEIVINAFILDENRKQIGNNYFTVKTRKDVSWSVSAAPSDKFYFKNGETTKEFKLNIINTGSGKQDIFVNHRTLKDNLILYDTTGRIIKNSNYTISLDRKEDTTLSYVASVKTNTLRNKRRISTNGYVPNFDQNYENHSLFINTSEPNTFDKTAFKKSNRISFVKLPNQDQLNDYGYSHIPLIAEANIQNVLDDATFMSLNLRGFKQLNAKASISYFSQLNYTTSFYSSRVFRNSPWYVGYFDDKLTVEAGQLSGNIVGITGVGKGLRSSYRFNDQHRSSAFWVRAPGLTGDRRSQAFGLSHTYQHNNNFRVTGNFGRQVIDTRNSTINSFSLQPNFNINQRHYFNLQLAASTRDDNNPGISVGTKLDFLFAGNYSTQFLDKRLRTNLGGRQTGRDFGFGSIKRSNYNHRSIYQIDEEWDVFLTNRYQKTENFSTLANTLLFEQELFTNNLVFSTRTENGSLQPGAFYDYRNAQRSELLIRGLNFRYSSFNFDKNYLGTFSFRAGYSRLLNIQETPIRDYFTFQFNTLMRVRVWSFSARYNFGVSSFATAQNLEATGTTPQDLRLSLQNQYQFKNRHLILESNLIYSYNNAFQGHNLGIFPEIFYFTNSGWRFSLRLNYNFSTRKFRPLASADSVALPIFEDPARTYNTDVVIGATVRKEFGIPVPMVEKTTASLEFIAFFDVNGNGIKERDEPPIENVVIQVGKKEVITNIDGQASLKHIPKGGLNLYVFSIEDLKGWFPNLDDSLFVLKDGVQYVPFTRGVKVYGDVVLDRQKIAIADTSKPFDLSRIKITASNGKVYNTLTNVNGRFEFYLPNGKYEITMDESILGDRYSLTRNNIPVVLKETQGGIYISFFIVEKRKKIIKKKF